MRIALFTPLKPIDDPVPSGDLVMARQIRAALGALGHVVETPTRLRLWIPTPDAAPARLADAAAEITRLTRLWQETPNQRPDFWLTYHVYHKAPDTLGPALSDRFGLPYAAIEASRALKRSQGPWASCFAAADRALSRADAVAALHVEDAEGLAPVVAPERLVRLAPFRETALFSAAAARHQPVPADQPVRLVTVAMMRDDVKLCSYRLLADALARIADRPWTLTVIGDGPARAEVTGLFAPERTRFLGALTPAEIAAAFTEADLFVWPALSEAFGMALIEAQAAGLPVVAGRTGGVPEVVADGETGLLPPVGDADAFAGAVASLIADPARRDRMAIAARERAPRVNGLAAAEGALARLIQTARTNFARRGDRPA